MSTAALSPYVPSSLAEAEAFAERLSKSPLVPDALKGKPGDILIIMATGHELGLAPMAAIRGLFTINGRVGIASALAVSLVKQHGSCEYFQLVESSAQRATFKTRRKGETETTMTFTIQQAQQAGYLSKPPWRATPEAMLRARCARNLAETVFPDALYGMPWDGDDADEQTAMASGSEAAAALVIASAIDATPAANNDTPAPPETTAPAVDPVVEMLGRIEQASTPAGLRQLAEPIKAANLGAEPRIRDAYASRHAQMRRAGGAR